ncbi:putative cullin protein, neddylation [Helianthus annuus]|uniref:Cullin-4 n=1 Tax=Helianthus annuus TaxID=4232 RepID=A0A251S8S8_HELAN|nr:cullin-4 [Helianthus annuus]KAF5764690.1 putative cullin protein, neddylation [Helianthus annuus]KAJ0451338.1 putative cullin protein, neddylation [Helianthus annuus]KAJ0473212.1 putative cullin protein, neddylation [Helianthus annuus]KAJ0648802.1 putative cullin protein, neddylation [Helianthus annuus]KAJ0652616.1 putative cullin protein, neddylation [Helianthus annuus]
MSKPYNNNNRKRSSTTCTPPPQATTGPPHFSTMKKAKSQALNCSQFDNNSPLQDHPSSMLVDPTENDAVRASAAGGFTANLARKKATLPQPAKKLVIKLVKAKPTLPSNFEETTWAVLKSAISAIFLKQPDPCDLEKLYQAVNDLCLHKMGGSLYQRIEKECEAHIYSAIQSLVGQSEDLVVFLSLVQKTWQDFCDQMLMIRGIALYLDRTYVKQTPSVRSLWDMGLQLFWKHLSQASEVEHKTVFGLLKMIESERLGEAVDRTLVSHLLKMFTALGIYSESFEKPFLECTSEFYAAEGVKYMQHSDVPDYLKHVEVRLHEENDRCLLYLDASTRKPLVATAEKQLLELHISAILDKGFTMLMDGNRTHDLRRMYTLFSRVNALESLRHALSSYIRKTGQGIVTDEEKDKDMVSSLLEFKMSLDKIWEDSFSKNDVFSNTIKEAFEHLINLRQNRPAELIAKFLDEKLRAGNKGTSEEELEGTLDKVLVLFRFIQGKDVFEAFYKKDLAKRLLLGKSASIDAEKSMISKLKTECGSQFTNKLEGMFKDIELSKEINESFKQSSQARSKLPSGIELSVHVLTTGYWPTYPPMDVRLPHELNVYQDIFKEFYLSKYSGRRLMWQNSLGHCVLKAEFPKGKKELAVSLFQTVVLMLFNDAQNLSFQDIKDATSIEDKELRRTLQSLACGKVRVLQKIPKGREVDDNDSFMFNDGFTAPLYRIKVNAIQLKETVEENASTTERVFQDRQYQVDAAIVRIMKTRKILSHTLLITELFQQLKFPIKPVDLKKRIESLIDREYLERDKNNPQIYNYLA